MAYLNNQQYKTAIDQIAKILQGYSIRESNSILAETKIRIEESHIVEADTIIKLNNLMVNQDAENFFRKNISPAINDAIKDGIIKIS